MSLDDAAFTEARRMLDMCRVCNYCSGFCEMFRAANRADEFGAPDITFLAHLCHDCGNCLRACQYAPPHVFDIDPPKALEAVRTKSWPGRPWLALLYVALVPFLTVLLVPAQTLFAAHRGPGAFYEILPWTILVVAAGGVLAWSLALIGYRLWRFWRETGGGNPWGAVLSALGDILVLRNLRGGGIACDHGGLRRWSHHTLVAGFALCFASTTVATVYHHVFDVQAPYPLFSLPVILGSLGGGMVMAGCLGLWWSKKRRAPWRIDHGDCLLLLLFLVAATGFALLIWRETAAMGLILALHLGTVLGLFHSVAHGKLAHAGFRSAALLRAAMQRRCAVPPIREAGISKEQQNR